MRVFKSQNALRDYTVMTEKFFPQSYVVNDKGERNVVLRHLLRKFFPKSTIRKIE